MSVRTLIASIAASLVLGLCPSADAAIVGFLGSVDSGNPGVLGSLPRNFVLTVDYTPGLSGAAATGTFDFPATPNAGTTNTNVHPFHQAVTTEASVSISDNFMGSDILTITGRVEAGDLGSKPVRFAFSFLNPTDTIDDALANPTNIARLIGGQTTISFQGGGGLGVFNGQGVIRGAPEPSTMIALTGLICGGCGVGYRRKMKKKAEQAAQEETAKA